MKRAHAWSIVVLSLILSVVVVWMCYLFWGLRTTPKPPQVTSFDTCAAAGNPVMETYPPQCRDAMTGITYTQDVSHLQPTAPRTRTFASLKGVTIQLDNWTDDMQITSPFTVTGKVPGSWSFEASFPVALKDSMGVTLVQGVAVLQGDWMTDTPVPFTVTLQFTKPVGSSSGTLILRKDNPSGLPVNEDSLALPVYYK